MVSGKNAEWYVISLRPQGTHAALRRAAARRGARVLALSPWRVVMRTDPASRAALALALARDCVVFTSPAAVTAAAGLSPLQARPGQIWLAVGSGTALALHRRGVAGVLWPERMDSEGLLALPELQSLAGKRIGLITAPQGRDVLMSALLAGGAHVNRAEVYAREDLALSPRRIQALQQLRAPACVLISSGGALQRVMAQLPPAARDVLQAMPAVTASARLAEQATGAGFVRVVQADEPRNARLLDVAQQALA